MVHDTRLAGAPPPGVVRATPVAFIRAILAAYRRRGMDPAAALAGAHITAEELADSDGRVTARQMEQLSAHAMRELDDEALGWFRQPLRWGCYGMLARASLTSPNLRVALSRWCRHHGLLTQDISLNLQSRRGVAAVELREHFPLPAELRAFGLISVLRNVHGIACWLVDSHIALHDVHLPFPLPAYADELRVMFPGPILHDAATAGLRFDAAYLDMPVRRDEAALNQMLQRALLVMVKPYRRDRLMQQRVRQALRSATDASGQSAEAVARALHLSLRSLHRFLQEDGTSLQALKDEVRQERACQLLMRTQEPIKKIAATVGFTNAKSFARAFTRWMGVTPQQFRAQGGRNEG